MLTGGLSTELYPSPSVWHVFYYGGAILHRGRELTLVRSTISNSTVGSDARPQATPTSTARTHANGGAIYALGSAESPTILTLIDSIIINCNAIGTLSAVNQEDQTSPSQSCIIANDDCLSGVILIYAWGTIACLSALTFSD